MKPYTPNNENNDLNLKKSHKFKNSYKKINSEANTKVKSAFFLEVKKLIPFCQILISYIKNSIGVNHNNFDEYSSYLCEIDVNKNEIIKKILNRNVFNNLFSESNIKDIKSNRLQAKRCMQVIVLALLKCVDFKDLRNSLHALTGLNKRYLYDVIKKYIIILNEINPSIKVDKWLPQHPFEYDFKTVEKMITERNWKLISPKNQIKFDKLRDKHKCGPARVPLYVECNREHKFFTNAFNLQRRTGGCRKCADEDKIKYNINAIRKLVNMKNWILKYPKNQKQLDALVKKHNFAPNKVPLEIECRLGHPLLTNAHRLQQKLLKDTEGCLKCSHIKKIKYNIKIIDNMVRDMGGILEYPKNQKQLEELRKIKKCKPLKVPLRIRCIRNHIFSSDASRLQQKVWCLHCRERKTAIGTVCHPIFELLTIKSILLKNCNVDYEHSISSNTRHQIDIFIDRNRNFKENIELNQNIIFFPNYIKEIAIDFTFSISRKFIIKKFFKNYQDKERFLVIVLLIEEKEKKCTVQNIEQIIQFSSNIKFKDHIKILTFTEFLEFLDLRHGLDNWRSQTEDERVILLEFMKIYKLAIDSIDSDDKFKKLINVSEYFKKQLNDLE